MKKLKIIFYVIGVFVFIGGVSLFLSGMSLLNWNFNDIDATVLEEATMIYSEAELNGGLRKLDINTHMNVDIGAWDKNYVEIKYFKNKKIEDNISCTDGELEINIYLDEWLTNAWFNGIKISNATITINVPKNIIDEFNILSNNVNIRLRQLNVDMLKAQLNNSKLVVENTTAITFETKCKNSKLITTNLDSKYIDNESTNSRLQLQLVSSKNNYNVILQLENSNSNITSGSNNNATRTLQVILKNSKLEVTFLE